MTAGTAVWHEVECGGYGADLGLWRELARSHPHGPVLDVGAGTGRVALEMARGGRHVVALDTAPELLEEARRRAAGMAGAGVVTVCADAREFVEEATFGLIIVAMQTVQLLGGAEGRARFLRCARRNLAAGGCAAIAVADLTAGVTSGPVAYEPDVMVRDGDRYSSRPLAVRGDGDVLVIERERIHTSGAGSVTTSIFRESVDRVNADGVRAEGLAAGFRSAGLASVPETGSYAGADVVLLYG